jgi:hypothetical protein
MHLCFRGRWGALPAILHLDPDVAPALLLLLLLLLLPRLLLPRLLLPRLLLPPLLLLLLLLQVHWHSSLDAVPTAGPSIYIAHEFLDALPVHQFVRDARRGWCEVGG